MLKYSSFTNSELIANVFAGIWAISGILFSAGIISLASTGIRHLFRKVLAILKG
jgi:hypothetical protein